MKILITGGAGFIGSAVVRYLVNETTMEVVNVDKLTYAGNLSSLEEIEECNRYSFEKGDICDREEMRRVFSQYKPSAVMHLAAESHVDRSIDGPAEFIQTNIIGTYTMLEVAKEYWLSLDSRVKSKFRFHHISTDEVYGSLGKTGYFNEETAYKPNSPYSASKASSDHLVRAWGHTYGLPIVMSNCSNNYGPFQFPEKLIPLIIKRATAGELLPIYGRGDNVRDWLYVEDHARALSEVITIGRIGETYNIGGYNEKTNLEVVTTICDILDELVPSQKNGKYSSLITFVEDRPGHDRRYAIDANKINQELGWKPIETFETGLYKTVRWYLDNQEWCQQVLGGMYQYERLGLGAP